MKSVVEFVLTIAISILFLNGEAYTYKEGLQDCRPHNRKIQLVYMGKNGCDEIENYDSMDESKKEKEEAAQNVVIDHEEMAKKDGKMFFVGIVFMLIVMVFLMKEICEKFDEERR